MRRLSRRRFVATSGAAAAGAAAALVVGCGDGEKLAPTAVAPAASATPARLTATRGGILRTYNFDAQPPETLDPHTVRGGPVANMHSAVFSKLLRYSDERSGTIVPDLAEGLPEQPDELTYVFKLRDGVTFHDSARLREAFPAVAGRALVAGDVRYSVERQIAESRSQPSRFPRQSEFGVIERVIVRDDHTITFKLTSPVAPFLNFIAGRHAFIIPEGVVDPLSGEANHNVAMIGTGPFMLESFEPRFAVKLRRNPDWFARDDDAASTGSADRFWTATTRSSRPKKIRSSARLSSAETSTPRAFWIPWRSIARAQPTWLTSSLRKATQAAFWRAASSSTGRRSTTIVCAAPFTSPSTAPHSSRSCTRPWTAALRRE